jgi:subfamily B ATP-binding cassette protein MsbA
MADINTSIYETIFGIRIIKAFSMEGYERGKFDRFNSDFYRVMMKSIKRMLLLPPATEFIGSLGGIFVFFWLGRKVITGETSFGVFALYIGSLLSMIRPCKKLSQVISLIQQALAANTRIYEVLDTRVSIQDAAAALELNALQREIRFESVSFQYAENPVLTDIGFTVRRGQVMAIVGPSGVGKSTLVDLIPRFYDPVKGRILIDGVDIKNATIASLRRQIGIVTQETVLFNDTVRNNIAYGDQNADQAAIRQAARDANADDFISKMPQGYDTVIGDRGFKLSGGEKQRMAIARAILKNPAILILDEATSQLDAESEALVQQALERLIKGRTAFVIAHRLSTIKNADFFIVLDKGRIVQSGTHEQLVKTDGLYSRLYQMQSFR